MVEEAIETAAKELYSQHFGELELLAPNQSWDLMANDRKEKYRVAAMRVVDAFLSAVASRDGADDLRSDALGQG